MFPGGGADGRDRTSGQKKSRARGPGLFSLGERAAGTARTFQRGTAESPDHREEVAVRTSSSADGDMCLSRLRNKQAGCMSAMQFRVRVPTIRACRFSAASRGGTICHGRSDTMAIDFAIAKTAAGAMRATRQPRGVARPRGDRRRSGMAERSRTISAERRGRRPASRPPSRWQPPATSERSGTAAAGDVGVDGASVRGGAAPCQPRPSPALRSSSAGPWRRGSRGRRGRGRCS